MDAFNSGKGADNMLQYVEEYCQGYFKISGGYFIDLLHREYGTPKTTDYTYMRWAVSRTERCDGKEKIYVRNKVNF